MHNLVRSVIPALLAALPACSTVDHADYATASRETGVTLTKATRPQGSTPVGMVFSEQDAFYLFALYPLRAADMARCLRDLATQAKALGADGVASISMDRETARFFSVSWIGSIQMHGEAYRSPGR